MSKINSFSKQDIQDIRTEINQALEEIAQKRGITLKAGSASFSGNNFTLKVEGAVVNADGNVMTKEASEFKLFAHLIGLKPEDLGREFPLMGKTWKLTGYNSRKRKNPILCLNLDDQKSYCLPVDAVVAILK